MSNRQVVSWSKQGNIATITIDHPPLNVLNKEVVNQLSIVADEIESDSKVKVVILTGAGEKAFMAGADIKVFPEWMGKGMEEAKQKSLWLQAPLNKIEQLPQPTIAAMNGTALGGGCELALCCDMRMAEEQVNIGLPEITLGLFPGAGGTQRLSRLIGKAKAKEMIFTGRALTAEEAKQIGLVNEVVPRHESLDKATELAELICSYSSPSLSLAKEAIDDGYEQTLTDGLVKEAENFGHVFQTKDVQEGVEAFIQKRSPVFKDQ